MRITYEVGDKVTLVHSQTQHRVVSEFSATDPVLGSAGYYQYLTLDPPGPSDVFDATDSRRVIPAAAGLVFFDGTRVLGVSVHLGTLQDAEPYAAQLRSGNWNVRNVPVHLDASKDNYESFRILFPTWYR